MSEISVHELLVAGSFLMAGIPVGCSMGFPGVLIHQLKSNDSTIQMDWESSTWIGSIHGIASIPSVLMPVFMQWRGRKLTFVFACLVNIIGWIIAYSATSFTHILISESLHGFSTRSILSVGVLTMSEMLSPRIRNVSIGSYLITQNIGIALAGISGSYLHWKTVTLVVCAPIIIVTVIVVVIWPESPSWLACKGKFDQCAKAFKRLRGTGELAQTELRELILAQKEVLSSENKKQNKQYSLKFIWPTYKRRDFRLPLFHIFVLLLSSYWTGGFAILIYSSDVIPRATFIKDSVMFGNIAMNIVLFIGCITTNVIIRYIKPKRALFGISLCEVLCLLITSGIHYCQTTGIIKKESYICLYLLIGYMYILNISGPIILTFTAELMPVKHRGIGGPLYMTTACLMYASITKIAPYLFKYIDLWGTLLVFAVIVLVTNLYIWKYIPETKDRTLQQLEDYYAYGDIDKHRKFDPQETLQELMLMKK